MERKNVFKKILGVVLIIIGIAALVTPLTPGSWLIFVGLEFFGIRLLAWKQLKEWFSKRFGGSRADEQPPQP